MKVKRTDRLDSVYQREIANIIRTSLKDECPSLKGIISVTGVSVAPDLKNARVLLSVYAKDDVEKRETFLQIKENAGFIRHELSQVMRMRTVPALEFTLDNSMEYGAHMDELFRKIHVEEQSEEDEQS